MRATCEDRFRNEPIAIIGSAYPPERFNADAFFHPDGAHHGTSNVTESYFLQEDPRLFDAAFFNIKPIEAHSIDPQHRILLEVVYESLEAAGQPVERLANSQTGCYVGLMCGDFSEHIQRDVDAMPAYMATGTARSLISNRISYFFDWHGPSMTIDTACSSSLFAVHEAVQLLRSGDSNLAVAAGSNIILGPELYIGESKLKMLSPTGRSRMWDEKADGYARGEGVAAIILKRLSDAIRDGDHIESVIRESAINSDGRTKGLTMPNELAQADLITRTYRKAGLDLTKESERCQFFEAHGTGTEAGDCREAEGISRAFLGYGSEGSPPRPIQKDKLYVGSIKTVIGHTEGTAGLAGLLKASLAIQHATIPPNMLFDRLSPKVAPFYNGLEIATETKPWPKINQARRASVNSFGFGGANAHVILESFEPSNETTETAAHAGTFTPFVFSAASETALDTMLEAYATHLREQSDISVGDLSYTLHSRRSALGLRAAFPAVASAPQLASSIEEYLAQVRTKERAAGDVSASSIGTRPVSSSPRVLGIFTGQGAQWAGMGRELIQSSTFVRSRLQSLESALFMLPEADRPSWSLIDELLAGTASSRIGEARIAQPLCTAIQIVLVDLLRAADIQFAAVVGHSSGEIAAAYAAGMISAEDAIKIAYYRGLCVEEHVKTEGAMMAVGTTFDDATELCSFDVFEGRLCVAACNSPSSVTLSGDADAVERAKEVLEDEKKFARRLKVDKAYHSHHMAACSVPYKQALNACNLEPHQSKINCAWYSSVYTNTRMGASATHREDLKGEYWKDNMVRPVLFAQALETAIRSMDADAPFNMVVEVGPHAALKGPASETLAALYVENKQPAPPYTGTLSRGSGDVGALSAALGAVWARFSAPVVNFGQYDSLLTGIRSGPSTFRRVVPNLPTYKWDHDRVFWHDSRRSRALRNRKDKFNPLLGRRTADGVGDEMRWRNFIRPSELPWISGHQLQGQMVYPAAAYLSTAIEASAFLTDGRAVDAVEIRDFDLGKAMVFDENTEQAGIETLFALSGISKQGQRQVTANFAFYAALGADADVLSHLATGRILVTLAADSDPSSAQLVVAQRAPEPADTAEVGEDAFYSELEKLGYEYTDDFRALSGMRRKINYGSANVRVPGYELAADALLVHPALLDAALQAIFLAYWYPGDGSLDQLHVPTGIGSLKVNTSLCKQDLFAGALLPLESVLTENPLTSNMIGGDVEVYGRDGHTPLIQVYGVRVLPLAERTSGADRQLFREHVWGPSVPDGALAADNRATPQDFELAADLERMSVYYLKRLTQDIPLSQRAGLEWHHEALFDYAEHVLHQTARGRQRFAQREWLNDTWDDISHILHKYPGSIEVELSRTVGENLTASVRGETQILQHMFKDNLLNRYYVEAMGLREPTGFLGRTVAQIVHRYPRMDILEIGAGTGGATKAVFREIGQTFSSYTFTDISTGFMEKAQEVFAHVADKMVFKALDIEKDVVEQGYAEHSYDLVIASLVLHATKSLDKTMQETRRLLKPGGYLVLLEMTSNDVLRVGFAMSGLPGWWLGREDGRQYSPCVSSTKWHQVLLGSGFSGIDTITPEVDILARPLSVIVSQAVDQRVNVIREPLSHAASELHADNGEGELVIIGGQSLTTVILIDSVLDLTRRFGFHITRVSSPQELGAAAAISPGALVLNVAELDQPIFHNLTRETMKGIQSLVDYQRTILWVTQGCRADQPYMNMSVGLGRTLALEAPDVRLQFLDLDISRKPNARLVAETLLRLHLTRDATSTEGMLFSVEQEVVEEAGLVVVPRLLPIQAANDRYNATKRSIFKPTEIHDGPLSLLLLVPTKSGYMIREAAPEANRLLAVDETQVYVTASTLMPVTEQMYGVVGRDSHDKSWVLGLSHTNGTRVAVQRDHLHRIDSGPQGEASVIAAEEQQQLLALLVVEAQCSRVLQMLPRRGGTLVMNEPPVALAVRLSERAGERDAKIIFTVPATDTAYREEDLPDGGCVVVTLSPTSSKRAARAALPTDAVSLFVDCAAEKPEHASGLGSLMASCMPPSCRCATLAQLSLPPQQAPPPSTSITDNAPPQMLRQVVARRRTHETKPRARFFRSLSPTTLVNSNTAPTDLVDLASTPTLVDWTSGDKIPVRLGSVDGIIQFDGSKTYVLFGLTSDLGRSLVDWMASHGAKNVVLTSRHPDIDPRWLDQCRARGMRVQAFANDITDASAVEHLVGEIRRCFPPIAGIMHGAMVLEDAAFSEMSLETMNKVVRPKVLGAIHLDRIFQHDSLDFFVFFSSLAAASGNRGQSNYSAANMYMTAKTFERRRKGLAASVLHLGAVMGVGYVMREASETVFPAIRRAGFQWMDERAFHQCVAEAILAGRPGSGRNPEIVTGLRVINIDEEEPAPWMDNPRFQHCIVRGGTGEAKRAQGGGAAVAVKARLLAVTTPEEAVQVVTDAFLQKLQIMLQVQLQGDQDRAKILAANAADTGIDSLVAVEIRSWFQKEMEVDVPVLKILGGATIADLIAFAHGKLPETLTPNIGSGSSGVKAGDTTTSSSQPGPESTGNAPGPAPSARSSTIPTPPAVDPASSNGAESSLSSTSSRHTAATPDSERDSGRPQELEWERTVAMSVAQSRFWFLRSYIEDQTTFNITFSVRLKGPLQIDKFESAIHTIGQRHQALRTAFVAQPGQQLPVQAILKKSLLRLEKRDIQDPREASAAFQAMKNHVFAIERGESMRLVLLSLSPLDHFLVVGYHHINMDGASLEVFMADLTNLYTGRRLAPNPFQYPDFAAQQELEIRQGKMDSDLAWWQTQLAGMALFRLLDAPDLCIGMADANRFEGDLASSMGLYLNLLPLRFRLSGNRTFQDALKDTRRTAYSAMAHSQVPFDLVLNNLKIPRSTLHSPLFQAFISYRAGVAEARTMGAVEGEGEEYHFGRTAYDLSLDIMENPGSDPRLMFVVQKQLYSEQDADILADAYMNLLDFFARNPAAALETAPMFAPKTIESAIRLGQGSTIATAWPETIVHRVDEVMQQYPDTIAVREPHRGGVWNYKQLRDRTAAIARALLAANITRGARVAVFQEPGLDWICSAIAIMRIGAVFIPVDVGNPVERLATIIRAAKPAAALVHDATESQEAALAAIRDVCRPHVLHVSQAIASLAAGDDMEVPNLAGPDEAAMVLFTSGSTGVPKGVVILHEGIPNFMEHTCNIQGPEVVLLHSALGFDMATFQCFAALAHGGTLVVAPRDMRGDPVAITALMAKESVTCTGATPSEYHSWIQYGFSKLTQCKAWRIAMTAGEACTPKLVEDFRTLQLPDLHLWNCYGPSEITWGSNHTEIPLVKPLEGAVTVGKAMPNRSVYILDERLQPVCIGMPGEIAIGGAGVGLGYLDNEALTRERFIADPCAPGKRMYLSGDRGRLTATGELEILGRIDGDSQIKLRGIRIEMQDIEQTILRTADGALVSVCVTARGDPPILVAHAVFRPDCAVPEEGRDAFLHRLVTSLPLPQYMHPAAIVPIASMPLNSHGKLDRRAVQRMPVRSRSAAMETSSTDRIIALEQEELQLLRVWQRVIPDDVLSLYTVQKDTDFFHVGGNSILLIQLQNQIKQEFGVMLTLVRLFEKSTLGAMAAAIRDVTVQNANAVIDWEEETALSKDLIDAAGSEQQAAKWSKPAVDGRTIILTGATGFVGRELLGRLVASQEISTIHCIAVRDPSKLADLGLHPKVSVHAGDLTSLEDLDERLFSAAHAVVHCGADVSFMKSYATLRRANVTSTKTLARLALRHGLHFHYISTTATGRLLLEVFGEQSLAAHPPPPNWLDNYVASKWASEVFLERAAARLGLRVWVHRPSSVTGAAAGDTDVVSSVARLARKMRAVPVSTRWRGALDFVSVEEVADGVVHAVLQGLQQQQQNTEVEEVEEEATGNNKMSLIKFQHHSGGVVVPIQNMREHLEREDGVEYRTVPLGEWIEMAVSEGLNVLVAAYLASVEEMDMEIVFQKYVKG
ncbi:polyketide synthetase [Chaetomium strumarium]|uniref:Polyketide synthetase n=1 Tax=Chaetomium strumarium TaxID=1170767 RepID=A0AAJ0GU91_9PEZI|nr:polyketide synthetase [Chaetomium strumarium]